MVKKISCLLLFGVVFICVVNTQQTPLYSQYTMNGFLINPAVAGSDGFTTLSLTAREQWVGFKGTPKTHAFSIDTRMLNESFILRQTSLRKKRRPKSRASNVGLGAHVFNDINGPLMRTGINGAYAYHLDMGLSQLSFGLSITSFQFRLNTDKVDLGDELYDELIHTNKQSFWVTDANVGIYLISKYYYAGYSAMQIFESGLQFSDNVGKLRFRRQHNLLGGYKFEMTREYELETSFLFKFSEGVHPQLDMNIKVNMLRDYWVGLAFRTGSAVSVYGGLKVDRYYFGYAFDWNFNSLMRYTFGSHEIIAAVKFGETARRYRWLNNY